MLLLNTKKELQVICRFISYLYSFRVKIGITIELSNVMNNQPRIKILVSLKFGETVQQFSLSLSLLIKKSLRYVCKTKNGDSNRSENIAPKKYEINTTLENNDKSVNGCKSTKSLLEPQ